MKKFFEYLGFGVMIFIIVCAQSKCDHDEILLEKEKLELKQIKEGRLIPEGYSTPVPAKIEK